MKVWIIEFTLPSGKKMAALAHQGSFAMVPFNDDGTVSHAIVWPSHEEAEAYRRKLHQHPIGAKLFDELDWQIVAMEEK